MAFGTYNFKKFYPDVFAKIDPANIPFMRNGEGLTRAPIHLEDGNFYPDLPQGVWDQLGEGQLLFQPVLNGGVSLVEIRITETT